MLIKTSVSGSMQVCAQGLREKYGNNMSDKEIIDSLDNDWKPLAGGIVLWWTARLS